MNAAIGVACNRQRYLEAIANLASEFQGMIFGNILFGEIVGIVVDATSSAMHQYPDSVTITLIPAEFATARMRDEFFDRMRTSLTREAADVKDRIDGPCARRDCDAHLAAADAGKAEKLAAIGQRRASAKVAGRD